MSKKVALLILDGWGYTKYKNQSAIYNAHTPYYDSLLKEFPNTLLNASGNHVGVPKNCAGNSEVGHLNIGSGRIPLQPIEKINKTIEKDNLLTYTLLQKNLEKIDKKDIHIMGLASDGSVHSHIKHIIYLIKKCIFYTNNIYIHAFTDGRDTNPKSSIRFLNELNKICNNKIKLSTIIGRYYSMDRDQNWDRIKIAYDALVYNKGTYTKFYKKEILKSYNDNITDEFLKPIILEKNSEIKKGDTVIYANFRKDRARELTYALTQEAIKKHDMKPLDINFISMTRYDARYKNIAVLFEDEDLKNTIGEVISKKSYSQLRIAETEKYAHVTYFFSGGNEEKFKKEDRILIPSPKVKTFDKKPNMSAFEVTSSLLDAIKQKEYNFICLNYANPDMVAHTGNFNATIKACECVDYCLSILIPELLKKKYICIITSDHGNADKMINNDQTPNTSHSINKVPFIYIDPNNINFSLKETGALCDIAPTILKMFDISKPTEMTGERLIV